MNMKIKTVLLFMPLMAIALNTASAQTEGGISISLVNQDPDPARAGDLVELRFMVENQGSREINNLGLELLMQYPLVEIAGEDYTKTISTLSPYQQGTDAVMVKFKARVDRDAVDGTNEIKLDVGEALSGIRVVHSFDMDVSSSEFAQIIYIDRAKLYPGEETELKFTITNVGNSPLSNLVFSWSEEDSAILPVYSDDTKYIKYIGVGDSAELVYTVVADINADSGLYQLDLKLEFESGDSGTQEMETRAGVFIGGETDFDVTFSESSEGQTSLSVANIGNTPALSVTVRIPEQEGFRVTGSSSSIIGNLDKGDYTIVSFQISQSAFPARGTFNRSAAGPGFAGDSDLLVLIEYTDTTGVRHTVEKEVPIEFRDLDTDSSDSTAPAGFRRSNPWGNIITAAALAVLIAAGYLGYRKRRVLVPRIRRILKRKRG
jgi:hypothetical protein